jgi:hypothetical protein
MKKKAIILPLSHTVRTVQPPEVGDEWEDGSAVVEQVGDDPETPVLTFRMCVLGTTASCVALSFLNAFFGYRHLGAGGRCAGRTPHGRGAADDGVLPWPPPQLLGVHSQPGALQRE